MDCSIEKKVVAHARELLAKSAFPVTDEELGKLKANDFDLGQLEIEGFAFIDILRTPRLRITLLILLPDQTLPQHIHPAYEDEPGKEETLRVIYGQTSVFVRGESDEKILIPDGKDEYYTARKEICLQPGEQYTVNPTIEHWFQAGSEGAVNICFQNRVDETKNLFYDPKSTGCPIKPNEK